MTRPIEIQVELACSPADAFRSWTDADEIKRWWGDDAVYRTVGWTSEPVEGRAWRADFEARDGSRFGAGGHYVRVSEPHRLDWTWTPDWDPQSLNSIAMTFVGQGEGTLLTVLSEGFKDEAERDAGEWGWREILKWLQLYQADRTADGS